MSIKVYNSLTGEWEVRASNQASQIEIDDVTGELETEDVEGALTVLVDKIEDIELATYSAEQQIARIDEKVNSVVEEFQYHLDNHPSGGGGTPIVPTITSEFENNTVVDKEQVLYIPIFFTSGNLGEGNAYILINNIEVGMQTIKQGANNIKIGTMPNQLNTVSIYVKDRAGMLSNQLTWTIICGGIEFSSTFDWEADYPMGEELKMPFTVETTSEEQIIMYITVDQDIYMFDCVKGYNEYIFKELAVGIHKISFYIQSGKYKTSTYNYNLVIVDSNNLYVSTTFISGTEVTFGELLNINYRVSKASTENFTINLYLDGKLEKTQTAKAGSYFWTLSRLPLGEHTFKIEATGVQGDYSFVEFTAVIVEGIYVPLEPVTGGLLAYFNAKNKTNQDDGRETWTDESGNGVVATLHNFNYGNNGWMGDYLQCSGDSYVEIDMQPYLNNVTQGSTIDIHFNMTSIGVEEARVLDYTEVENPQKGIFIDTLQTKLVSETSTGLVKLDENVDTRLTYVIDRQNRLAIIYLNGVINRVFKLSDSGSGVNTVYENFAHKEKIYLNSRKGQDLFADCKIYSLRVYGRALSHEEILQNHIADIADLNKQEEAYKRNYANTEIPEVRMYGDTSNMTGEIFQTMRIKYTSPNEELYGQSFDTMYNEVRWQGTSSQQYNMKNYQVYLKDNNMADMYYNPFPGGIEEHIFCFKCNYMESSHMNNTGIATFANDCVFTTPNPAQARDSRVRNSINGFPVLMYINDQLEGVYTFNLDRYSTNSLGYDTRTFPNCLSYEISANSDTTAGAFVPWTIATGKTERDYLAADFRCRYPDNRVNGDDDFAELKRLVDWVGNATDDMFREQIDDYFDLEYLIRYYLVVMCFGLVDNLGKNTMLTTFDGRRWYMQLYDCDSCTGLDNSGAMKFEPDIEVEASIFNTSNSRLWTKLRNNFPTQILSQWEQLRLSFFTEENIMEYLDGKISSKVPEINYNLDAWKKYIDMGTEFLFACHGNRKQQITRWIRERLIYMDTLLGYTVSTNDYITVRANKLGEVYFDIQTFQPMYFSIKFRNEENNTGTITKRIARGETVRFSYTLPVATDQEILVYGGRFIKDLGDLTNFNPTNLLLGNATRLTRVKCNDSPALINASISNCSMLQEVDLRGCSNLGAGSDASLQTLDLTQCRNLRKVDIFGTQLTALYTSQAGGIIQEIVYPYSIQIVQVQNQARLTSLGIPCYYTGNVNDENNVFAERLTEVNVSNCPNVTTFVKNYCTNPDGSEIAVPTFIGVSKGRVFNLANVMSFLTNIDLSYCSNIESMTLDNFYNLTEINFDDIAAWDATSSNLYNLTLTNCPNVETLTFNQNTIDGEHSLGVAFKEGTVLDLSGLYNLKHVRSNVGVKGLKKLILPLTIQSLVFDYPSDTTYSLGDSDIEDIFSKNAPHDGDGFHGIDLLGIETITDFSMGSLTKMNNAINLDIKITGTFPYFNYFKTGDFFKPEGTVDISEYRGSLEYLFKGVDLDKLHIICTQPLPHTSGKYMFAFASGRDVDTLNTLFNYMPSVTDFSYMFYYGYIVNAPYIPLRAQNVSYMFYNNSIMETTPSNWNQSYPIIPLSDYCYTGCAGITTIDGQPGSIDVIPTAWGGYDRKNKTVSGETLEVDNTLEREFVNFTASGQTLHNIVPEIGQTPTVVANKSQQTMSEVLPESVLVTEGEMTYAQLDGMTLVNLASEKRSSTRTTNQPSKSLWDVDETFIPDDKPLTHKKFEGQTMVNIIGEGETPVIRNNKSSFAVHDSLDPKISIKDGTMLSAKLYGETMTNLVDKTVPTDDFTVGHKQSFKVNDYVPSPTIAADGEFNSLILEGNTLRNILPENGNTTTMSIDNHLSIKTQYNVDPSFSVKDGKMPSAILKGNSLYNVLPENKYTPIFTTNGESSFSLMNGLHEMTVLANGEMVHAVLCGNTAYDYVNHTITNVVSPTITYTDENNANAKTTTLNNLVLREHHNRKDILNLKTGVLERWVFQDSFYNFLTKYTKVYANSFTETDDKSAMYSQINLTTLVKALGITSFEWSTYGGYANGYLTGYGRPANSSTLNTGDFRITGTYAYIIIPKATLDQYGCAYTFDGLVSYAQQCGDSLQVIAAASSVITENVTVSVKPYAYANGNVRFTSTSGVMPKLEYQLNTTNSYYKVPLRHNAQYTLKYSLAHQNSVKPTNPCIIGGLEQNVDSNNCLVTTGTSDVVVINGSAREIMLIEGDVREQEFRYFTGGKGVESPILYNTGKNLFREDMLRSVNKKIINGVEHYVAGGTTDYNSTFYIDYDFAPNTSYTFSATVENPNGSTWTNVAMLYTDGTNKSQGGFHSGTSTSLTSGANKTIGVIFVASNKDVYFRDVQIEANTVQTEYEPHVVTKVETPSNLVLHGLPSGIRDELDLLTGTLTRRVFSFTSAQATSASAFSLQSKQRNPDTNKVFASFTFMVTSIEGCPPPLYLTTSTQVNVMASSYFLPVSNIDKKYYAPCFNTRDTANYATITLPYSDLGYSDDESPSNGNLIDAAKAFLKKIDITFYYPSEQGVTEQIDLTNQPKPYVYKDGHITFTGTGATPLLDYQLPASNIYENLSEMASNTSYTLRYDGNVTSLNIGGRVVNSPTSDMLITSGSSNKNLTLNGTDIDNVMLFNGDVRGQDINYFTGTQFCNVTKISDLTLSQPVQLNKLSDTVCDTYNVLTGEYVQKVGKFTLDGDESWVNFYIRDTYIEGVLTAIPAYPSISVATASPCSDILIYDYYLTSNKKHFTFRNNPQTNGTIRVTLILPSYLSTQELANQWLSENKPTIYYELETPVTTHLEPQQPYCYVDREVVISTETNTIFPKTTCSTQSRNVYDASQIMPNTPVTQRNATEISINGTTIIPTEVLTFTEEQLSSGTITINDNGKGLMLLQGDYTGRDIPYFKGMRSVEGVEIVTTPSEQPTFGKGGKL